MIRGGRARSKIQGSSVRLHPSTLTKATVFAKVC